MSLFFITTKSLERCFFFLFPELLEKMTIKTFEGDQLYQEMRIYRHILRRCEDMERSAFARARARPLKRP